MNTEDSPQSPADTPDAAEPEDIRHQLAAREARLNEVVALVSHTRHELNNMLTGVLGQAQLVLLREELSPNARRRLETLEDLAKRMRDKIAELNGV